MTNIERLYQTAEAHGVTITTNSDGYRLEWGAEYFTTISPRRLASMDDAGVTRFVTLFKLDAECTALERLLD